MVMKAGHHHHRAYSLWPQLLSLPDDIETVHISELGVHEHTEEVLILKGHQSLLTAGHGDYRIALGAQNAFHRPAHVRLIIDNQYGSGH